MLWKASAIDVVVGTPGRLVDLAGGGAAAAQDAASMSAEPSIRLDRVALIVLDEADKLLASSDLREQEVSVCAEHKKPRRLLKLLDQLLKGGGGAATTASSATDASNAGAAGAAAANPSRRDRRVLIFANKIKAVSFVAQLLQRHGVRASTLSSRLAQHEREATLRRFVDGHVPVLVATDVAARGVHIDGLRYVINWDFGSNLEQYVHRIGRTGRQGEAGTAYSFFSRALRPLAPAAVALLRAHHQSVDQYLDALAREVSGEATRGAGADLPPAPAADDGEEEDEGGGAAEVSAVGGDHSASSGDDDDERCRGSAQRWLAARLKSPITGVSASFATSSARATGGSANAADSDDDSE